MFSFSNVCIKNISAVCPPVKVSSDSIEDRLKDFYDRCKLPLGRLELMTGIKFRNFWEKGDRPSKGAIAAGNQVISQAKINKSDIGALVFCSVSRDFLEPATASVVHHGLELSPNCMVFDVSNACLGFLNSIILLGNMIETGQIKYGLIVSSESGGPLVEQTIQRILNDPSMNRAKFKNSFASLTIGSGAVAAVLSDKKNADSGLELMGASCLAASQWVELCQGGVSDDVATTTTGFDGEHMPDMQTDSETMLHAGIDLAKQNWEQLKEMFSWANDTVDYYFCHQVGRAHQKLLFEKLGIDETKDFPIYQDWGNTGSAALPISLALGCQELAMSKGQTLAMLGIGSGLNSVMIGAKKL